MSTPTPDRLTVRVPASTSNLGPGFDLLGLALDLFVDLAVAFDGDDGPLAIELARAALDGARPDLERALRRGLALGGRPDLALDARFDSAVPHARGLGSSGAIAAAGVLLGAAAAERAGGRAAPLDAVVDAAVQLEGHPDNAVAALFGGCTLALRRPERWRVIEHPIHPSIAFAVAWPTATLATADARRVLPDAVPFDAAADQPRRLAALLEGLRRGDGDLLAHGLVDHLHEAPRRALVDGASAGLAAARAAGAFGATLSGSGSALVALAPHTAIDAVAAALGRPFTERGVLGGQRVCTAVVGPPRIEVGA